MPRSILRLPPKQCLPKMISYLSHKYPDKPHDQIVAIGASECGVSRKNDIGLDAGIRAALHLAHYKEKYPTLSLHENLAKAYHKVMMVDDMVLDMLENGQEQPLDAIFLELAHDFEDTISVRETKNYIRKRQFEPSECEAGTYRTFTLASGKKAVGCKVNGKFKVQSILEKKKKDFTIRIAQDFEFNSKNIESLIRNLKFNVNIRNKLPENTYIFHGTSVPLGALEDDELTISKSIDQEEAIFFTIDVDEAFAYGDTVIAIPIKDLPSYTQIERNTEGNEQEQSTLMIRDDVPLPESTLIKYGKTWYGKIEFYRMEDPSAFEIEEFGGEKRDDPIEIKELVQRLNNGHGKGWFGESERHSRARKEGHADLTEDQSPLGECTSRGYTEEECFKFFNKGKQAGISSEITYSKEGLEKLDERGQENLKEMVKEVSLLPKKIRRDLKIKIYNSFEKILPWDLEKNDTWLGFWNNKRQEIGFAADKLSNTSKRYARSSMLHEIGHKLYDLLPRYQREYVGDQYWKFKTQLEQSFDYHDRYVAKSASEYFADMFARVNESKKGTGARFYGEPYFKEMLKDYKRNREDFISDTISKILFIRKNYKEKWFFGFRTIQEADMTEDAAPKTASYRAPRAGTPAAMAGGARRTTVGQALKGQGVPLTVSGPESVTLPFKILNTETGELVEGEVIENLEQGTVQMQPVSSSNVRSVGQAQNELVIAFHSSGEGRFYRFKFSNQEMASEARNALLDSSSPGRWIWHNIRGHQAGEAVTPSKIGPAITSGKPTIGGTSASLVNYRITPVGPSRVKGYKEAYEKLQRQTSNPSTDPSTGARIEGLLGARKGFRELGRKIRQDHACDFTMEGMLTRSGEFDYRAEGQGIKIKTPENLKWIAENTDHVPVFGKRERGSHQESEYSLIGFAHQFTYIPVGEVDDYAHIYGKTELFKDIKDLSDLENPRELPVSFGFDDIGEGGVQKIIRLHHLAVSLNKIERDRCSTMNGPSCTISPISQVDMRQKLEIKPLKTVVVSLKK